MELTNIVAVIDWVNYIVVIITLSNCLGGSALRKVSSVVM